MREIKFRAWDKKAKKMVAGLIVWDLLCDEEDLNCGQFDFMQYTGLKDKNGKEIYEGDICRNGDWEKDAHAYNYRIEEVVYESQEASFRGWNFNEDGMTCEVIGNIYENPELLKRNK